MEINISNFKVLSGSDPASFSGLTLLVVIGEFGAEAVVVFY